MSGRLFDKVWDRHLVASPEGEPPLIYIDLHLIHEVTSPQAFEGLSSLPNRTTRAPLHSLRRFKQLRLRQAWS